MDKLPLVLVTHTLPGAWLAKLQDRCSLIIGPEDATFFSPELKANLDKAEGLFTLLTIPVTAELVDKAPRLRVVSNMAVGVDNIDLTACTRRGIPVGNTPGVLTEGTADLTMALLLAVARGLFPAGNDARFGRWKTWRPAGWLGTDLSGATLGIVGMGKIGRAVAQRALGFGMKVVYTDTDDRPHVAARRLFLDELLQESDFVSLHPPLTSDTRGLINANSLRKMKPTAYLINAARGPIIDTAALVQALQEGRIAGCGLDVTDPEPLPPNHPLFSFPNCLILPHIGSATWNTRRRMAELACDNLLAGLARLPLPHCVNPEVYR